MRLKTYFADAISEAMNTARQELGPDALLVHSKRTATEHKALGAYEVVFALSDAAVIAAPAGQASSKASVIADAGSAAGESSTELRGMKEALDKAYRLVRRTEAMLNAQVKPAGPDAELSSALAEAGFSKSFRTRALREIGIAEKAAGGGEARHHVAAWLNRQVETNATLGTPSGSNKTVAFIGPAGAGKTTSLVKLAIRYAVAGSRSAQILAIDGDRIGAMEHLRCFAGILGLGITVVESPHQMQQALHDNSNKELIMIDCPGVGRSSETEVSFLGEFLAARQDVDKHLVLPADAQPNALKRFAERFLPLKPDKVLLTRLDEAGEGLAGAFETVANLHLPLSFCGIGTRVPEDLEIADPASYVERLLPDWLGSEQPSARARQAAA